MFRAEGVLNQTDEMNGSLGILWAENQQKKESKFS